MTLYMIARNDDSPSGRFTPKKYVVVHPDEQPRKYISVLSHVEIDLPDNPMRYTAVPNALEGDGIWAASGVMKPMCHDSHRNYYFQSESSGC